MSKINNLIKELQAKQKKIDYISYIADLLKGDTKCVDYKEVQEDVLSQIEPLLLKLIESIENDLPMQLIHTEQEDFSREQINALRQVADRVLNPKAPPPAAPAQPQATQPAAPAQKPNRPPMSNQDKIGFAMENRHLANKKVEVINDQNVTIVGTVVGLDAPFVIVKTDSGPTIEVPLEKVVYNK